MTLLVGIEMCLFCFFFDLLFGVEISYDILFTGCRRPQMHAPVNHGNKSIWDVEQQKAESRYPKDISIPRKESSIKEKKKGVCRSDTIQKDFSKPPPKNAPYVKGKHSWTLRVDSSLVACNSDCDLHQTDPGHRHRDQMEHRGRNGRRDRAGPSSECMAERRNEVLVFRSGRSLSLRSSPSPFPVIHVFILIDSRPSMMSLGDASHTFLSLPH